MNAKKNQPFRTLKKGSGLDALFGDSDKIPNEIDIDLIQLPPQQPRRYFDSQKMKQLTESVKNHGIIEPLLVRPLNNGKYELVAGERRLRAAIELNLTSVPVSIKTLTDLEAKQIALIENLQREDLNPVEETEGILELLSIQLNQNVEQIISLLYRIQNEAKGKVTHNVIGNEKKEKIEQVFQGLSLMTWESYVQNRLPLLKLPSDILSVLREGQIAYTKAIALSKIKDEQQRKRILEDAIELNLSLREIKEKIKELDKGETKETASAKIDVTLKQIKKKKLWETEPKKWEKVEKLLEKINLLLD